MRHIRPIGKHLAHYTPVTAALIGLTTLTLLSSGLVNATSGGGKTGGLSSQGIALYKAQCPAIASAQLGQKLSPGQIKAYCDCTANAFQGLSGSDLSPVAAGGAQGALSSPKIWGLTRQCAAQSFGK